MRGGTTFEPSELLPYALAAGPLSIQPTAVARPVGYRGALRLRQRPNQRQSDAESGG